MPDDFSLPQSHRSAQRLARRRLQHRASRAMSNRTKYRDDKRGSAATRRARKLALLERDGGCCVYCRAELTFDTLTQDRIVPGGRYVLENLVSACFSCNRARSNNPAWNCLHALAAA